MTTQTHLTLRLPARAAAEIEAAADAAGVSVSAWARDALARRLDAEQIVSALRADLQSQVADLNSKLKLVSDQLAALSLLLKELRK